MNWNLVIDVTFQADTVEAADTLALEFTRLLVAHEAVEAVNGKFGLDQSIRAER